MIGPNVWLVIDGKRLSVPRSWDDACTVLEVAIEERDMARARDDFRRSPWVFAAIETALLLLIR